MSRTKSAPNHGIRGLGGNSDGNHATVAVCYQHEVGQVLIFQYAQDLLDVELEVILWRAQVRTFAKFRVARREETVVTRPEGFVRLFPGPAA